MTTTGLKAENEKLRKALRDIAVMARNGREDDNEEPGQEYAYDMLGSIERAADRATK